MSVLYSFVNISCRRVDYSEIKNDKIEKARNWFQNYITTFEPHFLFQNVKYRWDMARINRAKNGYETIVVPIQTLNQNYAYTGSRSLIIYPWKNGKGYYAHVLEFVFEKDYLLASKGKPKLSSFSGLITTWSLKKGSAVGAKFESGKITFTTEVEVSTINNIPTINSRPSSLAVQVYVGPSGENVYVVSLFGNPMYTYGGGILGYDPCEYTACNYGGGDITDYFDQNFWNSYINTYWNAPIDFFDENVSSFDLQQANFWKNNNIDTSNLDSCRQLLVKKIIDSLGSSPLGILLSKLDNAIGIANTLDKFSITFLTQPLANHHAQTVHQFYNETTKEFEADIILDSATSKNATELFLANTIFHEIIHAYMAYIWLKVRQGATLQQIQNIPRDELFNSYIDTLRYMDSLNLSTYALYGEPYHHNYMADQLLNYMADKLKKFDGNRISDERYYWYMTWSGLTRPHVKTWKYHWPNFPTWPPSNPAPSEDSTRGLKYALTQTRIDSIYNIVLENEEKSLSGALGRKPISGGCY